MPRALCTVEQMHNWVYEMKLSDKEIAFIANATPETVRRFRHRNGISRSEMSLDAKRDQMRHWVEDLKMSDRDIARAMNAKPATAARARLRYGIRRQGERKAARPKTPEQLAVIEAYLDDGYSMNEVSKMTGSCPRTIAKHFPGRGFTRKQSGEAAALARWANQIYKELNV